MRKRASITVFSALAFALVASFLMALLEAGRVYQIQTYADMKSTLALESVCAEYQPVLWEEFHLLGLDGAYGGDIFSMDHVTAVLRERLDRNLDVDGAGGSILQVTLAGAEPVAYRLMTDQEGSVFLHCVAAYMKQNMAMETIRALQERYGMSRWNRADRGKRVSRMPEQRSKRQKANAGNRQNRTGRKR